MGDGAQDEENEEDGCDGDVEMGCWETSYASIWCEPWATGALL